MPSIVGMGPRMKLIGDKALEISRKSSQIFRTVIVWAVTGCYVLLGLMGMWFGLWDAIHHKWRTAGLDLIVAVIGFGGAILLWYGLRWIWKFFDKWV